MGFDWDRLNKFMNEFIPFLVQQDAFKQRQQQSLQNTLQRYKAYGESQKDVLSQELMNKMWQLIMETAQTGAEEQPYPTHALTSTLKEQLPPQYTQDLQLPENYEDTMFEAQRAAQEVLIKLQLGQPIEPGDLMPMIQGYGYDTTKEAVKEYIDRAESEAERNIQDRQLEQAFKELEVRRGELGVRQTEAATKRMEVEQKKSGEATNEELQDKLEDYLKERSQLEEKAGRMMYYSGEGAEQAQERINTLTGWINGIQKELGMRSDEEYRAVAEELKAIGVTRSEVQNNSAFRRKLEDQGFEVWVLLGYLPESYTGEVEK